MTGTSHRESAVDRIRERVEEKAARRAAAAKAESGGPAPRSRPVRRPARRSERELPGIHAEKPTEIPWAGWKQIVKRSWAEHKADNMPIIAGGVAFFGFLSIFPALIALISLYGLVASPETVARQVEELSAQLPDAAAELIAEQLSAIVANSGGALTFGLIVSILAALWSASGGVGNLVTAVNIAYDEVETRNFVKLKLMSLGADARRDRLRARDVRPRRRRPRGHRRAAARRRRHDPGAGRPLGRCCSAVFAGSLAVLYRVAPDRDAPRFRWVSLGAVVVTVIWALVSVGVQPLREQLRVLRQDLRRHRRRHRADAVAVPDLLPGAARRGDQLRGRAPDRPRHHRRRAAADGRPRREDGRHPARDARAGEGRQRPDARRTQGAAQRTCDGTNGGFTTSTGCGRPRTSTASSVPSATPAAASISASAMPGAQGRRERAAGDLADPLAGGVEHRHARARDAPPGGAQAPQQPRRAGLLLGQQRLAAPERRLLPADRPAGARLVRRDVARQLVAVQRVAHLGAQRVARAEPAQPDALVLAGLEDRVPQLAGPVGVDQELVAVLAGVAGAADGHLGARRPPVPVTKDM